MGAGIGKTTSFKLKSQEEINKEAQERYDSIARVMGRMRDFVVHSHYFWSNPNGSSGTVFDSITGNVTIWTADVENDILDIWFEGHFVDHGGFYFDGYMKWLDAKIDKELLGGVTSA